MATNIERASATPNAIKHYINVAIPFVLMIGAHFVPPVGQLTELGVQILGIFLGMIYGWCFSSMLWPSILGILMLGFTSYTPNCFGAMGLFLNQPTVVSMIGAFMVFAYANDTGLTNLGATWLVTRKFFAGRPWVFMAFLMFACFVVSSVFNCIVLIIVVWQFLVESFKEMGMTKDDAYPTFVLIGVAMASVLGALMLPFLPNALYLTALFTQSIGRALTLSEYLISVTLLNVLILVVYFLLGRFMINGQKFIDGVDVIASKQNTKIEITVPQKSASVILLIFVVGMSLVTVLPKSWFITQVLTKLDMVGICAVLIVFMSIILNKEGQPLSGFTQLMKGVQWDTIWLVGAILVIATSMTVGDTGIVKTFAGIVVPMIYKMGFTWFCIFLAIFLCIITQFSMNMILQLIFAPILAPIVAQMGYNPIVVVLIVYFATSMSMLSPSASVQAGLVFSNEMVNVKTLYKLCVPWTLLCLVMVVVLSIMLGNVIV